jgi:hypothetical protein
MHIDHVVLCDVKDSRPTVLVIFYCVYFSLYLSELGTDSELLFINPLYICGEQEDMHP